MQAWSLSRHVHDPLRRLRRLAVWQTQRSGSRRPNAVCWPQRANMSVANGRRGQDDGRIGHALLAARASETTQRTQAGSREERERLACVLLLLLHPSPHTARHGGAGGDWMDMDIDILLLLLHRTQLASTSRHTGTLSPAPGPVVSHSASHTHPHTLALPKRA